MVPTSRFREQNIYVMPLVGYVWYFGRLIYCYSISFYNENDDSICNEWKYCSLVCFHFFPMDMLSRNYQNFMELWVLVPSTHQCQFIPACPCFLTLHSSSRSDVFNRGIAILWMFMEMRCIKYATFSFSLMYGILNIHEMYGLYFLIFLFCPQSPWCIIVVGPTFRLFIFRYV